jgi:hypothetical protein
MPKRKKPQPITVTLPTQGPHAHSLQSVEHIWQQPKQARIRLLVSLVNPESASFEPRRVMHLASSETKVK